MNTQYARMSTNPSYCVPQEYFNVWLRDDGIIWLQRRDVLYPDIDALNLAYDHFLAAVDDWLLDRRIQAGELGTNARTSCGWLCDLRAAPARRNDPEFERVVAARRPQLLARSPVLALLVQSAAGKMQATRFARTAQMDLGVFDDFGAAVDWLVPRIRDLRRRQRTRNGTRAPKPNPTDPKK